MKSIVTLLTFLFCYSAFDLKAQLIVYEPFDYPLNTVNPLIPGTLPVTDDLFVPQLLPSTSIGYTADYDQLCHTANAGTAFTSAASDAAGNIYAVYIDPQPRLTVLKKSVTGVVTQTIVRTNVTPNTFHVKPSVAVDKLGYIHVTGDMHNQPWVYYRSFLPEDISSFEQLTTLPGNMITYPQFFKDGNGDLFITFRHKVKVDVWSAGSSAGGIIRYDAVNRSFTMLGGENHGFQKTVVWSQYGGVDGHYQQPGIRLFFDSSNRMHLIATMIGEAGHPGASWTSTHLLYAYSDDGGASFYNLSGQLMTLPMTQDAMTVVDYSPTSEIWANAFIGAFSHNRPVIGWRTNAGSFLRKWTGDQWMDLLPEASAPGAVYMRSNGELAILRIYQGVYYSKDGGQTYKMYYLNPGLSSVSPTDEIVDREYFNQTGKFRFQFMSNSGTRVQGITVNPIP